MVKLGKWKYSSDELTQKVLDVILKVLNSQMDNAFGVAKGISEKTLRQLIPSLSDKEVKESLKKNEQKLTPKFNTFLIFLKDIQSVVKSNTTTWKNIYGLHKPSEFLVQVDDKDVEEDDVEEEVEIRDDEIDNVDLDDEEEDQEATLGNIP